MREFVMPELDPGIQTAGHILDARIKFGHDGVGVDGPRQGAASTRHR
jgi:hypothetical protein